MSNKDKEKYTIDDLSELTGHSRRTIRYYIQEGLVDSPAGRGKGGFYFEKHLSQLRLIKNLQEKGMSLSSISKYMEQGKEDKEKLNNKSANYKMSDEAFPGARQRSDMMKMKMDKDSIKEAFYNENKKLNYKTLHFLDPYALPPRSKREVWVKHEIAPGLEINIKRDLEKKQKRKIDDIIRVAREILGSD